MEKNFDTKEKMIEKILILYDEGYSPDEIVGRLSEYDNEVGKITGILKILAKEREELETIYPQKKILHSVFQNGATENVASTPSPYTSRINWKMFATFGVGIAVLLVVLLGPSGTQNIQEKTGFPPAVSQISDSLEKLDREFALLDNELRQEEIYINTTLEQSAEMLSKVDMPID